MRQGVDLLATNTRIPDRPMSAGHVFRHLDHVMSPYPSNFNFSKVLFFGLGYSAL